MSRSPWQREEDSSYSFNHTTGYHHDDMPVLGRTPIDPQQYPQVAQYLQSSNHSPPAPAYSQPVYTHHAPPQQVYHHHHQPQPAHGHYVQGADPYSYAPSRYSPPQATAASLPLSIQTAPAPHPFAGAMMQSPMQTDFVNYGHGGMHNSVSVEHQYFDPIFQPGVPDEDTLASFYPFVHKGHHAQDAQLGPVECAFCSAPCENLVKVPACGHVLGRACLEGWLHYYPYCPICGVYVNNSHLTSSLGFDREPPSSRYTSGHDADRSSKHRTRRGESAHSYADPRSSAPTLSGSRMHVRHPTVPEQPPFAPASPPTPPPQRRQSVHQINTRPPMAHHASSETYPDLKNLHISRPGSASIENQPPPRRRERGRSFSNRQSGGYALYGDPRRSEPSFGGDPRRSAGSLNNYEGVAYILPDPSRREQSRHRPTTGDDSERRQREQSRHRPPPVSGESERREHRKHHHHKSRRSSPSGEYERERHGRSRASSPSLASESSSHRSKSKVRYSQSRPRPVPDKIDYRPPSRTAARVDPDSRPTSSRINRPPTPSAPPSLAPSSNYHKPSISSPTASEASTPVSETPPNLGSSSYSINTANQRQPSTSYSSTNIPSDYDTTPASSTSYSSTNITQDAPATSTANGRKERAGVQPGQTFVRPDLKCSMDFVGACAFDDPTDDHGHNKLLRLDCGHGFHHECIKLTTALKERISTEEVNLEKDMLWCDRCTKYYGKKAGQ